MIEEMQAPVAEQTPAPAARPAEQPAAKPAGKAMPPEAKAAAQRLMIAAMRIVYKKEVTDVLIAKIRESEDPAVGIAQGVALVLQQLSAAAKGVPPAVIASMTKPIVMMIAELAVTAGLVQSADEVAPKAMAMIQGAFAQLKQGAQKGAAPAAAAPAAPVAPQAQQGLIESAEVAP